MIDKIKEIVAEWFWNALYKPIPSYYYPEVKWSEAKKDTITLGMKENVDKSYKCADKVIGIITQLCELEKQEAVKAENLRTIAEERARITAFCKDMEEKYDILFPKIFWQTLFKNNPDCLETKINFIEQGM